MPSNTCWKVFGETKSGEFQSYSASHDFIIVCWTLWLTVVVLCSFWARSCLTRSWWWPERWRCCQVEFCEVGNCSHSIGYILSLFQGVKMVEGVLAAGLGQSPPDGGLGMGHLSHLWQHLQVCNVMLSVSTTPKKLFVGLIRWVRGLQGIRDPEIQKTGAYVNDEQAAGVAGFQLRGHWHHCRAFRANSLVSTGGDNSHSQFATFTCSTFCRVSSNFFGLGIPQEGEICTAEQQQDWDDQGGLDICTFALCCDFCNTNDAVMHHIQNQTSHVRSTTAPCVTVETHDVTCCQCFFSDPEDTLDYFSLLVIMLLSCFPSVPDDHQPCLASASPHVHAQSVHGRKGWRVELVSKHLAYHLLLHCGGWKSSEGVIFLFVFLFI